MCEVLDYFEKYPFLTKNCFGFFWVNFGEKNAQLFILKYGLNVTGINYRIVKDCSSHDTQIVLFLKDLTKVVQLIGDH